MMILNLNFKRPIVTLYTITSPLFFYTLIEEDTNINNKLFLSLIEKENIDKNHKLNVINKSERILELLKSHNIIDLDLNYLNKIKNIDDKFNELNQLVLTCFNFNKDKINLKSGLKQMIQNIINSKNVHLYIIDNTQIDISKQTVFFEYSPIYDAVDTLIKECKDLKETQLEIEKLLNVAWTESLNNKIIDLKSKGICSEMFSVLHNHVIEFYDRGVYMVIGISFFLSSYR
jgi:hypothetical protein